MQYKKKWVCANNIYRTQEMIQSCLILKWNFETVVIKNPTSVLRKKIKKTLNQVFMSLKIDKCAEEMNVNAYLKQNPGRWIIGEKSEKID